MIGNGDGQKLTRNGAKDSTLEALATRHEQHAARLLESGEIELRIEDLVFRIKESDSVSGLRCFEVDAHGIFLHSFVVHDEGESHSAANGRLDLIVRADSHVGELVQQQTSHTQEDGYIRVSDTNLFLLVYRLFFAQVKDKYWLHDYVRGQTVDRALLFHRVDEALEPHLSALLSKYRELVYIDDNDTLVTRDFDAELREFARTVLPGDDTDIVTRVAWATVLESLIDTADA